MPPQPRQVVPRQLPAVSRRFVGRKDVLRLLDELLESPDSEGDSGDGDTFDDSAVTIVTLIGSGGIGKTTLALRWAHHAQDRFPDGQLYVNLRGFDPTDPPVPPDAAVRGFLYAFEVAPERMPTTMDAQSALYRSLVADRRMLVLLDNGRDVDQVRPLLPGTGKCFVLVTSRNRLDGLLVREGARSISLQLLDADEAYELMIRYIGARRVAAETDAVQALIAHCHGLPLALAIVAARAMTYPDIPLAALVRDLTRESDLLRSFDRGGADTGVEAAFSWSYRSLRPAAARTFRLCGLHPGPDVTVEALAALTAEPQPVTADAVAELATANFLEEYRPGRFRLHDLLQAYAAKRAKVQETESERRAALERVLDYYLHSAFAADGQLYPYRHPIHLDPPAAGVLPRAFIDATEAMAWFHDEIATLLALTKYTAANGWDTHAWQLPWAFATFLHRQGGWHDYAVSQEQGLAAAYRTGDPVAIARCERNVGRPYTLLGRADEAAEHYTLSLRMCRDLGDSIGEALCEDALTWLWGRYHRYADAIEHAKRALTIYTRIDNSSGRARALNYIGWNQGRLGNYTEVLEPCTEALSLFRSAGNEVGEADTLDSIGYAYAHLGRYDEAVASYAASVKLWRALGDQYNAADLLSRLGDFHQSRGNLEGARTAWTEALGIFTELNHPDATVVQAKLEELDTLTLSLSVIELQEGRMQAGRD